MLTYLCYWRLNFLFRLSFGERKNGDNDNNDSNGDDDDNYNDNSYNSDNYCNNDDTKSSLLVSCNKTRGVRRLKYVIIVHIQCNVYAVLF